MNHSSFNYWALFSIILIVSCTDQKQPKTGLTETDALSAIPVDTSIIRKEKDGYCWLQKKHFFSSNAHPDLFTLKYLCNHLEDSMILQIVQSTGNVIFELKFRGSDLSDYSLPWHEHTTDSKRGENFNPDHLSTAIEDSLKIENTKFYRRKIEEMFWEENFTTNPLKKSTCNLIDEQEYKDMLGDSTLVGFSYCIGSVEGFEMIAYSKKQHRVKTIWASD